MCDSLSILEFYILDFSLTETVELNKQYANLFTISSTCTNGSAKVIHNKNHTIYQPTKHESMPV